MRDDNRDRRILVVDDDPAVRKIVIEALKSQHYQVSECESGKDAIMSVDRIQPHLILLDVNMPGLDGVATLQKLRTRDDYVSVVFVSGQSSTDEVIRGLDAGADDYITKPFK